MKYNIDIHEHAIEISVIEHALLQADPAAMLDLDKATLLIRVSTCLGDDELVSLVTEAGFPISSADVRGVPSECCGGCGG